RERRGKRRRCSRPQLSPRPRRMQYFGEGACPDEYVVYSFASLLVGGQRTGAPSQISNEKKLMRKCSCSKFERDRNFAPYEGCFPVIFPSYYYSPLPISLWRPLSPCPHS
ncbi:unnamed protein product, partial [Phaeothamnion confervicola]